MVVTIVRVDVSDAPPRAGDPRLGSTNVIDMVATGNGALGVAVGAAGVVVGGAVGEVDDPRAERSRARTPRSPRGASSRTRSLPLSRHPTRTRAEASSTP